MVHPSSITPVETPGWLAAQHTRDLQTLDAQADLIASLEADNTRLRREIVILTGRWAKTPS